DGRLSMFRRFFLVSVFLSSSAFVHAQAEPGFVPLFDGKSLDGWDGNRALFRVESGAIVGGTLKEKIVRNEFLTHKSEFKDFELRLQFKVLGKGANAGVQIRS